MPKSPSDAADGDARLCRAVARDHQAGHEAIEVAQVLRRDVVEQLVADDLDRDRHFLQHLVATLRLTTTSSSPEEMAVTCCADATPGIPAVRPVPANAAAIANASLLLQSFTWPSLT